MRRPRRKGCARALAGVGICVTLPLVVWIYMQGLFRYQQEPGPVQVSEASNSIEVTKFGEQHASEAQSVHRSADEVHARMPHPSVSLSNHYSPTRARPVVALPGQVVGQSCNQYLGVALSFARAAEIGATVSIWGFWQQPLRDFDLEHMRIHSPVPFSLDHSPPRNAKMFSSWSGIFCGVRHSYNFTRIALRPSPAFRLLAEEAIARLRAKAKIVISIHLRFFEYLCSRGKATSPGWVLDTDSRPCHRTNLNYQPDLDRMCQIQLDGRLMDDIHNEWPETKGMSLGIYLSSDHQQPAYESTFFDKDRQNKYGIAAVELSPQGSHMLIDMWASTVADYYLAQPKSSCEPIIAQWRAEIRNSARSDVAPQSCFSGFGSYEIPLNKAEWGDC